MLQPANGVFSARCVTWIHATVTLLFHIRGASEIDCCVEATIGNAEIVTLCRPLSLPHPYPFTIRNTDSSDVRCGMQWNGPGNKVVVICITLPASFLGSK
jgi:hypothetical protein